MVAKNNNNNNANKSKQLALMEYLGDWKKNRNARTHFVLKEKKEECRMSSGAFTNP